MHKVGRHDGLTALRQEWTLALFRKQDIRGLALKDSGLEVSKHKVQRRRGTLVSRRPTGLAMGTTSTRRCENNLPYRDARARLAKRHTCG